MTTDTAIRTTQRIIENGVAFEDIKFLDYPEIKYNKYESTEMPFRYVTDNEGNPILPEGMLELIKMMQNKASTICLLNRCYILLA